MQKIIDLGGTVDAIHGAGLASGQYLERQLGPVGLGILKGMKAMLDPNNILNPGKRWETASP
jgi:glycolate oxidase